MDKEFEYMGIVEALGGGEISSDWLSTAEDVMAWGKSLGCETGQILKREKVK